MSNLLRYIELPKVRGRDSEYLKLPLAFGANNLENFLQYNYSKLNIASSTFSKDDIVYNLIYYKAYITFSRALNYKRVVTLELDSKYKTYITVNNESNQEKEQRILLQDFILLSKMNNVFNNNFVNEYNNIESIKIKNYTHDSKKAINISIIFKE